MLERMRFERFRQPFFWLRVYWWKNRILFSALAIGFVAYILLWSPGALANWLESAPSVSQAKEFALTFDLVLEDPAAAKGKPVRWHISHPGPAWFYRGDQSKPIGWMGPTPDLVDNRRPYRILATVVDVDNGTVVLSFDRLN